MKIVATDKMIDAAGLVFDPYARYVVADSLACGLEKHTHTKSDFNSYERRYSGQDIGGKRIAVWRHPAFGDQIMLTGLVAKIKALNPSAFIDVYGNPKVADIWRHSRDCVFCPRPMIFESIKRYDYHLFFERMLEDNQEPDQGNAYEDMFKFSGLSYDLSEPDKPAFYFSEAEMEAIESIKRDYFLYQWAPDNPVRAVSEAKSKKIIQAVKESTGLECVVVGKCKEMPPIEGVVNLINQTTFRKLLYLIKRAKGIICPDSSVGHAAAAFPSVPVIGLWGPFAPEDRIAQFHNHRTIHSREVCPHSPCRCHDFQIPVEKCRDAKGFFRGMKTCCVLEDIDEYAVARLAKAFV